MALFSYFSLRFSLSPLLYTDPMNTGNNSREITIEDLAVMIANGFAGIDKRFSGIDTRFNAIDQHFTLINKRFIETGQRFISIDKRFDAFEKNLEGFKDETAENFRLLRKDILSLDQKFVTRKEFTELLIRLKFL